MKKRKAAQEAPAETSYEAIADAVSIDPIDIEDEYSKIAGKIARYNELHAEALREMLETEREVDRLEAKTYLSVRAKAEASGKKITEESVKARVRASVSVNEAKERAIIAKVEKVRLAGVLEALRAKRDALISLGAHIRAEMQGNLSLREGTRFRREQALDDED